MYLLTGSPVGRDDEEKNGVLLRSARQNPLLGRGNTNDQQLETSLVRLGSLRLPSMSEGEGTTDLEDGWMGHLGVKEKIWPRNGPLFPPVRRR